MSSGIEFRRDDDTVRLAQAHVDEKCAVESPLEGLSGHGKVAGAYWWEQVKSYAILFEDGHEYGGFGDYWWGGRPLPPLPDKPDASLAAQPTQSVVGEPGEPPVESLPDGSTAAPAPAPAEASDRPAMPLAPVIPAVPPPEPPPPQIPAAAPTLAHTPSSPPSPSPPSPARYPAAGGSKARIITFVPFSPDADLGRAYNECMRSIGDDDWACFLDHDAVHTTRRWYGILEKAVADCPRAGLFSCVTNRVGSADQDLPGVDRNDHDMALHRKIGLQCADGTYPPTAGWPEYVNMDQPGRNWLAGVLMLTSKRAWRAARAKDAAGADICGFHEGYLFGVDNAYHKAQRLAGNEVYLLTRLYVYHWYRANGDEEHVHRLAKSRSYRE